MKTSRASALEHETVSLPAVSIDSPMTMTIFGASGDLTARKLLPSLYAMFRQGLLPASFAILGCARRDWTNDSFRQLMRDALEAHSRETPDDDALNAFCSMLHYQRCDVAAAKDYEALRDRLAGDTFPENRLFYLAIMPELFAQVVSSLRGSGLVTDHDATPWTRVVVEKPFGRDLDTARALNRDILRHLDESQVYRIDHYLGKETVQNILSFRFANAIFEPLFNSDMVEHVQITAAETIGVESGRGGYYDSAGAIRDMTQNHLLQLLCLVAMEPPSGMTAGAIHNEKVKVLQSVVPFSGETVARQVVRAQYGHGLVGESDIPSYREEDRVAADSHTETYLALRLDINNWRWAGVPFYLRTGKRLQKRCTEIAVQFRTPPLQLFQAVECEGDICDLSQAKPNVLVFRIQPDEGIALQFSAKRPAMQLVVEGVQMDFAYSDTWERSLPDAYERLLLDVMRGDSTLFNRSDEVEAAWLVIDPVLRAWQTGTSTPVHEYAPGSWGPEAADALFEGSGGWRNG